MPEGGRGNGSNDLIRVGVSKYPIRKKQEQVRRRNAINALIMMMMKAL